MTSAKISCTPRVGEPCAKLAEGQKEETEKEKMKKRRRRRRRREGQRKEKKKMKEKGEGTEEKGGIDGKGNPIS